MGEDRGEVELLLGGAGVGLYGGGVAASDWVWMEASSEASRATMAMTDSTGTLRVPSGVRILPRIPAQAASTSTTATSFS